MANEEKFESVVLKKDGEVRVANDAKTLTQLKWDGFVEDADAKADAKAKTASKQSEK